MNFPMFIIQGASMETILKVKNVYSSTGKVDPAVGISMEEIAGDENYGLYCAKLGSLKRVGAHFHNEGVESYQIIEGEGKIYIYWKTR